MARDFRKNAAVPCYGLRHSGSHTVAVVYPSCSGGFALLHCHASPVRDGWLPYDSGQTWRAAPALCLSLTPVHPACSRRLRRFAIVTPRSPPPRLTSLRLGTNSAGRCPSWNLFLAAVQSSCSGGSALLPCHASPAHDARLPSDSGHKQAGYAVLSLYPSLRSIRAVRDGSALLHCHALLPSADARFPSDSEQPLRAAPA